MDVMDIVSKGISKVTKSYGKKVAKKNTAPEIPESKPVTIKGDEWRVGFSMAAVMPDDFPTTTYYIAGHGSGHVMDGIITPVFVSAMWFDCGGDEGILWLGADIVGLTRVEVNLIRSMIESSPVIQGCRHINISVTHSHSGIDTVGYWGKPFASIPSNGKDPKYMDKLMTSFVNVAEEAYRARKSGKLFSGRVEVPGGLRNGREFNDKHEFLTRLRFVPDDGSAETWFMNFGAHPNTLGGGNRKLSGEYPYFMREIISEEAGANVLYTIGAIGAMDAARLVEDNPLECVKLQGKMIAEAALTINEERELEPVIKFIHQPFYLEDGNYVLTLLAMLHTMSFTAYPLPGSDIGIALLTEMNYFTFGDQKLLTLPGENFVSTVYGSYLTAEQSATGKGPEINPTPLAEIAGDSELIAIGVSNDMTGYVVPPNDFILNPTQPYLNGTKDRFGKNHYHETNSMGINTQKTIADTFAKVVSNFNKN